ncbi:br serine threonine-protein kinase 2-like [Lichtheimia corymbifera JMRC:FSU:9682]|uniref:Br serine threonine-protein kinase 2-like n=1 Tax=Lichtheimia corymbifera JMRC:FSU:9682 TaxID=1263082 RepID=A0A068RHI0_9FUNG|nr:br serine threonine-protein kinase 2-like [Lichtheimia corymbifera JMRC:FSU:9682]
MPPWMSYLTRGFSSSTTTHLSRNRDPIHQQQQQPLKQVGDYVLVKTIGRGSSGHVKLGIHKTTGEHVAIKMIPRRHLLSSVTIAQSVERELAILQLIHHPHLIQLKQVLQDPTYVYFITEYAEGGELYHALAGRGRLPEDETKALFSQVVTALAWCHAHHICHRDLKPENILLDKTHTRIKIADFGMATMQPSPNDLLATSCGSPHYASPEIVVGKPYYGPATDVWSCGVLLYVLLTGHFPFDDDHVPRLLAKIRSGRRRKLPEYLSPQAKHLVRSMLTHDPSKRITMQQVLQHPWLNNSKHQINYDWDLPSLDAPVITSTNALDGRIWETLKVLWRDMGQENIIAALMGHGDNVQKLTYRLLQQRTQRVMAECSREEKASMAPVTPPTPTAEDPPSFKRSMAASLTSQDDIEEMLISRCLSKGTSVSSDDRFSSFSAIRKTHELPPTPTQDTTKINSAASSILDTEGSTLQLCSSCDPNMQTCITKKEQHVGDIAIGDSKPQQSSISSLDHQWVMSMVPRKGRLPQRISNISIDEHIRSTTVPAWASTFAPVYRSDVASSSSSTPVSLLSSTTTAQQQQHPSSSSSQKQEHPSMSSLDRSIITMNQDVQSLLSPYTTKMCQWLLDVWLWCEHWYYHCLKHTTYKIYRLECQARREWEAAGKLQQTLHDYFDGRLDRAQNGIWSGSMIACKEKEQQSMVPFRRSQQEERLAFVCRFQPPGEHSHGKTTVIHFVFIAGTPSSIGSVLRSLTQKMTAYDSQARYVAEANGWITPC